jgi:hypothetical protein
MTINEFIQYLHETKGWQEWRIAALLNRRVERITDVIINHYPASKRRVPTLEGDPDWMHDDLPRLEDPEQILDIALNGNHAHHTYETKKCTMCRVQPAIKDKSYCRSCRDEYALAYKYALNPKDYQEILQRQGGLCAICEYAMGKPCVDHIHGTKHVRGLLCYGCNTALGKFHESPRILMRAIRYLQWHEAHATS